MRRTALSLLACWILASVAWTQPTVDKVEPPNWWIGHSINPVRLLIHGQDLHGAQVSVEREGVQVGLASVNAAGSYLFVDLHIDSQSARTGAIDIAITTPKGETNAPFELSESLSRAGRFQGFSPDDIIYLIMPDRFANGDPDNDDSKGTQMMLDRSKGRYYHGGDFKGIKSRLPYLRDLGVTAIWLNPVYDNANRQNQKETYDNKAITDYHGYGPVDFYAVEDHFGQMADLRELVAKAQQMGIKVILDQVANHSGPYHPWVQDSPTPTWYNGTEAKHLANTWQTWTLMDPHSTPALRESTLNGWFINLLPDLNQSDEEVSRYLIQNTLWWIGMSGIDGIRQDTIPYVPRRFWSDWMAAIKREYPEFRVVGELWDGNAGLVSSYQGGRIGFDGIDTGLDTLFDFPVFYPLRRAFAEGKSIRELPQVLAQDYLYPHPEELVVFLGSHDVPRFVNESGATLEGLKLAFTFILTTRGIPLIYYGDEIALPGRGDPDNRRDFPGGWVDDATNAFEASGRTPEQESLWKHVQRLAHLRKEHESLRRGALRQLYVNDNVYVYARVLPGETTVIVINNSTQAQEITFDATPLGFDETTHMQDELGTGQNPFLKQGKAGLTQPPRSASLWMTTK